MTEKMPPDAMRLYAGILVEFAKKAKRDGILLHLPLWKIALSFDRLRKAGLITIETDKRERYWVKFNV